MNGWVVAGAAVLWAASIGGAYQHGRTTGEDKCNAAEAAREAATRETREAAEQGAANAIAKLKPRNVTIRQETEREIREIPIYSECKLPAAGLRLANEAITGVRPEPASAGELPRTGATVGRHDGGAAGQGGGAGQPVP